MALFIVRHQHAADQCPAADPYVGAGLLNYLSRPNVRKLGVQIQGEAVVRGEHTMYLIVDAEDEVRVREFMQPFEAAGSVAIYPASTCARVVASGGCSAPMPVSDLVPAVDPEEACQQAIEAGLVVHRAHPLNSETSIPALIGSVVMPNAHFYVRNHFQIPQLNPDAYRLSVSGAVDRCLSLGLRELRNMPSQTLVATLECAGNGRTLFDPPVPGEKWNLGAVSTGGMDRRAPRRSVRSSRRALAGAGSALPRRRRRRRRGMFGRDPLRTQPQRGGCQAGWGAARLRDEWRAAAATARLSTARDRSRLVRCGIGEVADRRRAARSAFRRSLPDGQVPVRMGTRRPHGAGARDLAAGSRADHRPVPWTRNCRAASWPFAAWRGRVRRRSHALKSA